MEIRVIAENLCQPRIELIGKGVYEIDLKEKGIIFKGGTTLESFAACKLGFDSHYLANISNGMVRHKLVEFISATKHCLSIEYVGWKGKYNCELCYLEKGATVVCLSISEPYEAEIHETGENFKFPHEAIILQFK